MKLTLGNEQRQIIRYVIAGFCVFLFNFSLYYILVNVISIPFLISNFIAWIFTVIFAFCVNKKFVFQNEVTEAVSVIKQVLLFFSERIFTFCVEEFVLWFGVDKLFIADLTVKFIAMFIVVVLNYIISKYIVFKRG